MQGFPSIIRHIRVVDGVTSMTFDSFVTRDDRGWVNGAIARSSGVTVVHSRLLFYLDLFAFIVSNLIFIFLIFARLV